MARSHVRRKTRRLVAPLVLLSGFALAGQNGIEFRVHGKEGAFLLRGERFSASPPFGPGHITFSGKPALLSRLDSGVEVKAESIDGETAIDEQSGDLFLKSADVAGGASFTQSTEDAIAYAREQAKAGGVEMPPVGTDRQRISITSPTLHYSGNAMVGTLEVPSGFRGAMVTHLTTPVEENGRKHERIADTNAEITGASGVAEFFVPSTSPSPLRKGTVLGPATFKFSSHSTLDGKPELPTDLHGHAGRIDLDFLSKAKTITLTGSVEIEGVSQGYRGSLTASKAVLTFGVDGTLERIDMEGSTTNIKPQKSGGSR